MKPRDLRLMSDRALTLQSEVADNRLRAVLAKARRRYEPLDQALTEALMIDDEVERRRQR